MLGTYRNRHNDRQITIDRMEISDEGTKFWYAGEYDMFIERCLERNWDMVSEDTEHEVSLIRLSDAVRDICQYCIQTPFPARSLWKTKYPISSTDMNEVDLVDILHKFLATQLGVDSDSLYLREGVEAQMDDIRETIRHRLGVDEE